MDFFNSAPPNGGGKFFSSDEIEKFWIKNAIDSSSNGGSFNEFEETLKSAFETYRVNEIPIYEGKIEFAENDAANLKKELKDLTDNKKQNIKALRKAKRLNYATDYAKLKSEKREIERKVKRLRGQKYTLQLYLSEIRKQNSSPAIKVSKFAFYGISAVYIVAASILNFPIFQEVINGIPAGGMLAPIMGVIEGYMAHLIGMSFGLKNKKVGYIVTGISTLILTFLIAGQLLYTDHSILSSAFILLLFALGAVTSYIFFTSYFDRQLEKLTKTENELLSQLDRKQDEIDLMKDQIENGSKQDFNDNSANLKRSIQDKETETKRLQAQKDERLKQIDTLEAKIISEAKNIFNLINNF